MKYLFRFLGLVFIFSGFTCNPLKKLPSSPELIRANDGGNGIELEIQFVAGEAHNHPTFVFWIEDMNENFIQTLFVTKYIATGIFSYGQKSEYEWKREPGKAERPESLPYWLHKRPRNDSAPLVPTPKNPIPDAYTGATPENNFILNVKTDKIPGGKFRLLCEINQTWDWNEYWTNNKYPNNTKYKRSCQPSLVYAVTIDPTDKNKIYYLNPIGHAHFSGDDGELYTDLSTLTSALQIAEKIQVRVK